MIDRRQFVVASGSVIATAVAAALTRTVAAAEAGASTPAGERLDALFDGFMDERLTRHPEQLTSLGLDKDKYAWAKSKLNDESLASVGEYKTLEASQLKRVEAFDRNSVSGRDRASYDTVMFQLVTSERFAPFDYGSGARPYVVSQLTGSYQSVPTFLDRQHQVKTREDAQAYLERLRAFAHVLDEETERVRHDAGLKVVPPDFILDGTLGQMQILRSAAPGDSIPHHLARDARAEGRDRRQLGPRCAEDSGAGDIPGFRPPARCPQRAARACRSCGRRRAPAARGRAVPGGAARGNDDRHDPGRGAPARAHPGEGAYLAHGRHPQGAG